MEWICQFGVIRPRVVFFSIVKVGALKRDVATQVHLSSADGRPAAAVRLMAMVAVVSTSWTTSTAPHVDLTCGQATRASSVLWF